MGHFAIFHSDKRCIKIDKDEDDFKYEGVQCYMYMYINYMK